MLAALPAGGAGEERMECSLPSLLLTTPQHQLFPPPPGSIMMPLSGLSVTLEDTSKPTLAPSYTSSITGVVGGAHGALCRALCAPRRRAWAARQALEGRLRATNPLQHSGGKIIPILQKQQQMSNSALLPPQLAAAYTWHCWAANRFITTQLHWTLFGTASPLQQLLLQHRQKAACRIWH